MIQISLFTSPQGGGKRKTGVPAEVQNLKDRRKSSRTIATAKEMGKMKIKLERAMEKQPKRQVHELH